MSLVLREEYIRERKAELHSMVRILRIIYYDDNKLNQSIKKCAVLGDDISELKKHPDRVLEVFLPIILSYGEERTDTGVMHNDTKSDFKDAVDALLEKGVMEFYEELEKVR